jgi:hypothetical protein
MRSAVRTAVISGHNTATPGASEDLDAESEADDGGQDVGHRGRGEDDGEPQERPGAGRDGEHDRRDDAGAHAEEAEQAVTGDPALTEVGGPRHRRREARPQTAPRSTPAARIAAAAATSASTVRRRPERRARRRPGQGGAHHDVPMAPACHSPRGDPHRGRRPVLRRGDGRPTRAQRPQRGGQIVHAPVA